LQYVGLPAFLETAQHLGITSLTRPDDYGLSLTLGAGDVALLELTGAYAVFANGGRQVPPVAVLRILDNHGQVIEQYHPPRGQQVISPQHAYLITSILSDNEARTPAFGPNSVLKLSRPAAVKTGISDGWRDNWTIGYTPDLVAGVWVGNSDNTPMALISAVAGAGPIWHNFMEEALAGTPHREFIRAGGIETIEICADSGTIPSQVCPRKKLEIFVTGQGPLGPEHDTHQMVRMDRTTGQLATEFCPENLVEEKYFQVYPPDGREWAKQHGIPQLETCTLHTGPAQVTISQPLEEEQITGIVSVVGQASMPDFSHYVVEYGVTHDPGGWGSVSGPNNTPVESGLLAQWDTRGLHNMEHTLRVLVFDHQGTVAEARVHVMVTNPMPPGIPSPIPQPGSVWVGSIVRQISGAGRAISQATIAVRVAGKWGLPVEIRSGGWSTTALTGTKPEYGDTACEFGALSAGTYTITPQGLGASVTVTIDEGGFALVEFAQIGPGF
jgi:hypothetical protein